MNLKKLFFAAVIVLSANASFAQDTKIASHSVTISIPEVALLDLESSTGTGITLVATAPIDGSSKAEAGLPIIFGAAATNATIWMNYSSIVKKDKLRSVTVKIKTGDAVPTGLKLTVLAATYSGVGKGTTGTVSGTPIDLDDLTEKSIVTAIGSAYTGDGASNGHLLTYKLDYAAGGETANYKDLVAATSTPITITYTLSDGL